MAVTTKKTFNAVGSGGQSSTTVFTPVSIELNNQDDLDVYVTLSGGTRVLNYRQSTGSTTDSNHPQVNDTTGLYFPAQNAGVTLYNYILSTDNDTITFNSALPTGAVVSIERRTRDSSSDYTNFAGGSTIRHTDVNRAFDESNFTAQEARNKAFEIEGKIWDKEATSTSFITSNEIVDGTIVADDLASDSVTTIKIVDANITTTKIANLNVIRDKIANDAIDATKIADDSLNSEHYVDGSIDTQHIAADQITNALIADSQIDSEHYVDGSIDREHLAADIVDGTKIADSSINSEHYVNASIDHIHLGNDIIDGDNIQDNAVNSEHIATNAVTDSEIATGTLDNRYYTETELDAGQLDNRYYTETESDARYFNISTGDTIKDGDTFPDNDTTIATTAAINDRIIDLVDDVGGFVPIANETSFPAANPDVNNGAGTLVSIKALASNLTSNGSGIATIANGAGTGNTVTINGLENSTTYAATFGMIVETTTTLHTYAFHRSTPKATEVTTVAGSVANVNTCATNITNINTVASDLNEDTSEIDTVANSITNVNTVGNAITNVNAVGTNISGVHHYADVYQVATSQPSQRADGDALIAGDMWFDSSSNKELKIHNGSSYQLVTPSQSVLNDISVVSGNITYEEDLGLITESVATGTGDSIETCADNITKIQALGTTAAVADMALLATTDCIADMAILGTTDVVADLNTLATADVVSDMNTLAVTDVVNDMNTLATTSNVSNMNTVAASIADVNRYATEYTIASSSPGSPDEGDLWYNSSGNALNYYTGSSWTAIAPGIANVVNDSAPQLGGNLNADSNNITNGGTATFSSFVGTLTGTATGLAGSPNIDVGTIDGTNLQLDFGTLT